MAKTLSLSAFVMNTASHIVHGLWRSEEGHQIDFNDVDLWIDLAKTLEDGGFDTIFFADVVGVRGPHNQDESFHVTNGLQVPSNDPLILLSAIATHTKRIGLAFTSAPLQEPPFNFARRVSTLDHLSNGRVAWNIVTSVLDNAYRNFGYEELLSHDERYDWAEEYVDVLYKLWEGSWDEGALLKDRASGMYADASKVHKIHHSSERYKVEGPHLVSPSSQRTPVLFQAGASERGKHFGAKNAEAIFIAAPTPEIAKNTIEDISKIAAQYGRQPDDIKFYQGLSFVIGDTLEEAQAKEQALEKLIDWDMILAHSGGSMGLDLGHLHLDTPLDDVEIKGIQSMYNWVKQSVTNRAPVVADFAKLKSRISRIVGTPEQIADELEKWLDAGVTGINVVNDTIPISYVSFIEKVVPVLRQRGLLNAPTDVPTTLRKSLFDSNYVNERHPAAKYRGYFAENKEERRDVIKIETSTS